MKKKYVNERSRGTYKLVLYVFCPLLIIVSWYYFHIIDELLADRFMIITFTSFLLLLVFVNICAIWELIFGVASVQYELLKEGICTYKRYKKYYISWSDCFEVRFVPQMVGWGVFEPIVYFSTVPLDRKKAEKFMLYYGNCFSIVQYFQCDQERLEELKQVMPEELHCILYSTWYGIKDYMDS